MPTKSKKRQWSAKDRNLLTAEMNKYAKNDAEGISYEKINVDNTDYDKSIYDKFTQFQETEERYFNGHLKDTTAKFCFKLQERGTCCMTSECVFILIIDRYSHLFLFLFFVPLIVLYLYS